MTSQTVDRALRALSPPELGGLWRILHQRYPTDEAPGPCAGASDAWHTPAGRDHSTNRCDDSKLHLDDHESRLSTITPYRDRPPC